MLPRPLLRLFDNCAMSGLEAACEGLFPENDLGAPDWRTTDMVRRSVEYLNELPRPQRRLLLALFVVVELVSIVVEPHFCRFSRMPPLRRAALVRGWRRSSFLPLRVLGDALKAVTTVIYMSHPAVLEYIGAYSACDRPLDPFQLPVKREALRALDPVT